jgi:Domain of unknown function (DUF4062)/Ig-like domain from next to BRCA1 gene
MFIMSTLVTRRAFLSSTIYDLEAEREIVQRTLDAYVGEVRFECIRSDGGEPRFLINPDDLRNKHSYEICVDKVAECNYFVLLLNTRYGRSLVEDSGRHISITHREYREAYARRLPLFVFVNQRTWDARHEITTRGSQNYVPQDQTGIFQFIDEITHSPRSNWIERYRRPEDIGEYLRRYLFEYDDSRFVSDITVPDGQRILVDSEIEKTWEIENTGCVVWRNRFLQVENALASGLTPLQERIAIPETRPGSGVRITVRFHSPKYPGTCESYWKMVDSDGKAFFPKKKGLFCRVQVVDRW